MTEHHRSNALPGCAQQVLVDLGTGRLRPKWGSVCSWKRVKRRESATDRRWKKALCVKSVRIEPYVELGAPSLSPRKHIAVKVERRASSGEERRWWRILCGLTVHDRSSQLGSYAREGRETRVDQREDKWQIHCVQLRTTSSAPFKSPAHTPIKIMIDVQGAQ